MWVISSSTNKCEYSDSSSFYQSKGSLLLFINSSSFPYWSIFDFYTSHSISLWIGLGWYSSSLVLFICLVKTPPVTILGFLKFQGKFTCESLDSCCLLCLDRCEPPHMIWAPLYGAYWIPYDFLWLFPLVIISVISHLRPSVCSTTVLNLYQVHGDFVRQTGLW